MAVLVRNELTTPWVFEGSRGSRQIAPGEVEWVSDEEWATVISAKRGPGGLHPLSNDPGSRIMTKFDYVIFNGSAQVQYLGQATQGALDTDSTWTIKKFTYVTAADASTQISIVEVLESVAWANRTTLPW